MFTTLQSEYSRKTVQPAPKSAETSRQSIGGVRYNKPSGPVYEETPMGVSNWNQYFTGLDQLGEGQTVDPTNVQPIGDPNNPSGFTITRADPNDPTGSGNLYQTRALGVNPDGSVYWQGDGWQTRQQTSQMDHFLQAGLPMALAMAGGVSALGGAGAGGVSGMDLAADAALGSGNNIMTAGQALGGSGMAGTGIPAFQQLPGYGNEVATLADASGASPFTGGADPLAGYMTTGASEGSTLGNALTGAGGSAGAVGAGTAAGTMGTVGNFLSGAKSMAGGMGGLVNLGGNLLNSYLGYKASDKAADAQINAANQANALAKYMYDTTRTDNMPALDARNFGLTGYQNLLKDPSQITNDPGYQFGLQQGMNAYDNSGSARGMRLSGAQAKALTRYGQDYGQTKFNESLNRFGNLAGLGGAGAGTIASAGANYANTAGNNITGAGNAAASGYIGGANAITGGISNFLKGWQENQLLKQLGIGG